MNPLQPSHPRYTPDLHQSEAGTYTNDSDNSSGTMLAEDQQAKLLQLVFTSKRINSFKLGTQLQVPPNQVSYTILHTPFGLDASYRGELIQKYPHLFPDKILKKTDEISQIFVKYVKNRISRLRQEERIHDLQAIPIKELSPDVAQAIKKMKQSAKRKKRQLDWVAAALSVNKQFGLHWRAEELCQSYNLMARTHNSLSEDEKEQIVNLLNEQTAIGNIARLLNRSYKTIQRFVNQVKDKQQAKILETSQTQGIQLPGDNGNAKTDDKLSSLSEEAYESFFQENNFYSPPSPPAEVLAEQSLLCDEYI